ncbi:MAG TPA: Ig-like domain-containing protein, partial [Gemmatimonadaceae bacterium]
ASVLGLSIDNAHLRLTRATGAVARDVTLPIAANQDSLVIDMQVPMVGSQELFTALLELRQGEQVLFSGVGVVLAIAGGAPAVPVIPMLYVGPLTPVVSRLALVSTSLTGIVGQLLSQPLIVKALSATDQPVAGVPVTWTVLSGGGTVGQATSVTDAAGLASTPVTLGTLVGTQTVQATANGVAPLLVTLSALAAPASALSVLRQPSLQGLLGVVLPTQPIVRLVDQYGNAAPVAGVPVLASPTAAGFLLAGPTTAMTDETGVATFSGLSLAGLVGSTAMRFTSGQLAPVTSSVISLMNPLVPLPGDSAQVPPLPPAPIPPLPVPPLPVPPLPLPPAL